MDLTLWDTSFDQATEESNNQIVAGLEHDFYFYCGLDVIEESALNEKCCVQVLRNLITKADNEIVQLEDDLVMLQSQLALADEEFSQLCSIALRQKIDCLDILVRNLKSGTLEHECDFGYCLQMRREPAERLHDILKALLTNFSPPKANQSGDIICKESNLDRQVQATRLLVDKTRTGNSASITVTNLQLQDITITYANKNVISKKNLESPGKKTNFPKFTKPLAIIFPTSNSNGVKPAIHQFKEMIPQNSNSEISMKELANKSSTTSSLFIEDEQKPSTGSNEKKRLSNIVSRITNEKEIGSQSCTGKSIIVVKTSDASSNSSSSFSKGDLISPQRVKVREANASGTTDIATDSLLEFLINRRGKTTMPRSKRTRVQKAKEPGPSMDPVTQKRRKIGSDYSSFLEDSKALVKLENDEAKKMLSCPALLDDLTVIELRSIAKQRGMTKYSRLRKAELAKRLGLVLNNRGRRKGKK